MKTWRVPFSRIRNAWLRRSLMVMFFPIMLACNWLLILWAAAKALIALPLVVVFRVLAAPVNLLQNFGEAWHGRGPGSERPPAKEAGQ
ncbi:hypothetical protein [Aquabacterium sp.]|uniref:hypothetical protein n=1 Tax=Aquabacterium sp. TaxID=1872578 RepID=UPI0025C6C863|nr:hypothetical protein [Aquabacterium sp.]